MEQGWSRDLSGIDVSGRKSMTRPVPFLIGAKKAASKFLREHITQHSCAALCPGKLTVSFFLPKDIIFQVKMNTS